MSTATPLILTGTLIDDGRRTPAGAVVLDGATIGYAGRLVDLPEKYAAATAPEGWRDDVLLLPGLVDLHHHGGRGGEYGPDAAAGQVATAYHHAGGSTVLVGSLVSNFPDRLEAGVAACASLVAAGELEGIHLEGPFLSLERKGAQNPAALTDADPALVERLVAAAAEAGAPGSLVQMTFAPERPGGAQLPAILARHGIIGAVGHTDATAEQAQAGIDAVVAGGAREGRALATHLFNGMRPLHHRDPGPVAACLGAAQRGELVVEAIGDGQHLSAATLRMLFDVLGPRRVALITDALSACGMPPGRYHLGGLDITVDEDVARLLDGTIAGSIATMLDVVRFVVAAGVPLEDAVLAATRTPAQVAALDGLGGLEAGRRADVLVVRERDEEGRGLLPQAVYRAGVLVPPPPAPYEG